MTPRRAGRRPSGLGWLRWPLLLRRVSGESMIPALRPGQIVVARRVWRHMPEQGAIIIFRHNGLEKIKRVQARQPAGFDVRGDNAAGSTDSRDFGLVPPAALIGRVVWPRQGRRF